MGLKAKNSEKSISFTEAIDKFDEFQIKVKNLNDWNSDYF